MKLCGNAASRSDSIQHHGRASKVCLDQQYVLTIALWREDWLLQALRDRAEPAISWTVDVMEGAASGRYGQIVEVKRCRPVAFRAAAVESIRTSLDITAYRNPSHTSDREDTHEAGWVAEHKC